MQRQLSISTASKGEVIAFLQNSYPYLSNKRIRNICNNFWRQNHIERNIFQIKNVEGRYIGLMWTCPVESGNNVNMCIPDYIDNFQYADAAFEQFLENENWVDTPRLCKKEIFA